MGGYAPFKVGLLVAITSAPRAWLARGGATPAEQQVHVFRGRTRSKSMEFHADSSPNGIVHLVKAVVRACTPPPPHNRGAAASYDPSTRPERAGTTSEAILGARQAAFGAESSSIW